MRLPGTPDQLKPALESENPSVREPMEKLIWGQRIGSSIDARVTYWNLDEDSAREAILEFGGAGAMIYLIFDQDRDGWWYVGRRTEDNHYECKGTGISVRGITVFQLARGSLRRTLTADANGHFAIWGDPRGRTEYLQSFIRIEPDRLLIAKRYRTGADRPPSLPEFRHASKVECSSLVRDGTGAYGAPVKVHAAACHAWLPLE